MTPAQLNKKFPILHGTDTPYSVTGICLGPAESIPHPFIKKDV
jgi:hypothetical protein